MDKALRWPSVQAELNFRWVKLPTEEVQRGQASAPNSGGRLGVRERKLRLKGSCHTRKSSASAFEGRVWRRRSPLPNTAEKGLHCTERPGEGKSLAASVETASGWSWVTALPEIHSDETRTRGDRVETEIGSLFWIFALKRVVWNGVAAGRVILSRRDI